MVCTICYDSLFNPEKPARGRRSRSSAVERFRPAALDCGHVFHKSCINRWVSNYSNPGCPLCHNYHVGPALVLYIDADDIESNNRPRNNAQSSRSAASSSSSSNVASQALEIDRLCECFDRMGVAVPNQELHTSYDGYREVLLDTLSQSMDKMASKHASDLKRLQSQVDDLNNELSDAHDEIDRLNTLSGAHRSHIASLQNALEDKKYHLSWYVEKYGYEDPDDYDSYNDSDENSDEDDDYY